MWSLRVPATVHFLTKICGKIRMNLHDHMCTTSSVTANQRHYSFRSSDHFCLLSIAAKKSNIPWWYLVGFVPIIVGSEHNNTPAKRRGTAQARANRMHRLLQIKATEKTTVGSVTSLFCLQATSSVTIAGNINNRLLQRSTSGEQKMQSPIHVPHCSGAPYSVRTYVRTYKVSGACTAAAANNLLVFCFLIY